MSYDKNSTAEEAKAPSIIKTKGFQYSLKFFILSVLSLLMLIPLLLVGVVVTERESYKSIAMDDISRGWGYNQTFTGPLVAVPYKSYIKKNTFELQYINFSPDKLEIAGEVNPEVRYKGIFKKSVYTSNLNIKGNFDLKNKSLPATINPKDILWDKAMITLAVSDLKGISDLPLLKVNDKKLVFEPSANNLTTVGNGIHADLKLNKDSKLNFEANVKINGSDSINFIPVGKQNNVTLSSSWKDPSFIGSFLPTSKVISSTGFKASWAISYLASNYPQVWTTLDGFYPSNTNFGVSLLIPVDQYRNAIRAVTYGILFISLTFIACFIFEIVGKLKIHPFQYGLVGIAMALFYLLLISISEFTDFLTAYIISSTAVTIMITLYAHFAITKKQRPLFSFVVFSVLVALYSYLYVLLEAQDTSLLFGSIGLFITLAIIMFVTRNVNWYEAN